MSYWGKLLGGVAGFAVGGPMGAIMGAAMGHAADSGASRFDLPGLLRGSALNPARLAASLGSRDQLFAVSVVVLSAKLAKCDGPVSRAEIDAFKRQFRIPPESVKDVGRLFDSARDNAEGYESYARELGRSFADSRGLLEDVLAALFAIARADKPLTVAEHEMLRQVHQAFGLDNLAWDQARGAASRSAPEQEDAYAVLGAPRSASDGALREIWLRQVRGEPPRQFGGAGGSGGVRGAGDGEDRAGERGVGPDQAGAGVVAGGAQKEVRTASAMVVPPCRSRVTWPPALVARRAARRIPSPSRGELAKPQPSSATRRWRARRSRVRVTAMAPTMRAVRPCLDGVADELVGDAEDEVILGVGGSGGCGDVEAEDLVGVGEEVDGGLGEGLEAVEEGSGAGGEAEEGVGDG